MTKQKSKFDLSTHLDDLADLFPNGALQAATDPAQFIRDVIAEIKRLREWVEDFLEVTDTEDEDPLQDIEDAAQAVVNLFGPVKEGSKVERLKDALDAFREWKIRLDRLTDDEE